MSVNNITESIFDSISLIVEKKISNLEYDKTIICTITSIEEEKNNIYTVTDGSSKFKAQGDGAKYYVDDQVRVLIPQGDFSKEKYIQGKHCVDENSKPITYVSPLGSVLKVTSNLLSNTTGPFGIAANGAVNEILIGETLFDEDYIKSTDIFDTLYLKANFQTNFDQYDMREGDYGLHIKLITYDENNNYGAYGLYFSSKEHMSGNPYAFKIFTLQEVKYTLEQWPDNIIGLQLFLYQSNNFKYYNKSILDPLQTYIPQTIDTNVIEDIKVSEIEIGFGSEVGNNLNKKLKLYTSDALIYHSEDDTIDTKKLQLLWYNKTEDNEYIGFSDGIYSPNYDEDLYLATVALNTRLLARRSTFYPEDEISLTLAANIFDASAHIKQAAKLIGVDLRQVIQGFKDYTFGINWSENPFSTLLGNGEGSLGVYSNTITNANTTLNTYYDAVLKWAKDNDNEKPSANFITHNLVLNLLNKNSSTSVLATVDNLFTTVLNAINIQYSSYKSVYDTYFVRWQKIKTTLENIYIKINELFTTDPATLAGILNQTITLSPTAYVDITTTDDFKNTWNNKYCLYWYRADENVETVDRHAGAGWERLTSYTNVGIPEKQTESDYCISKTNAGIELSMRRRRSEKFIVILFQNHEKVISNELVFNNLDDIPDPVTMDSTGALSIEHYNEQSKDTYQLYNATGLLLNSADAQVRRQLRARFNGETGGDEQLIGATIYWYVPNIVTMLDVFNSDIGSNFNTDRVSIYASEAELNADYDRGRIYSGYTNLVGPNPITGKYLYYNVNPIFVNYKTDTDNYKIYNLVNFDTDDTKNVNYKYVVKLHSDTLTHITYQLYSYNGTSWVTEGEPFEKFIYGDANSNYYTPTEWASAADLDTEQEYLVGPKEGPFKYYKYVSDAWVETGMEINDLTLSSINIANYRPGYYCYYKTINAATDSSETNPKVKVEDTIFPYHIKDYYQQTATQNTILCVIKKDTLTYEASQNFTFSSFGNNGTDYTLSLIPNPEYPVITNEGNLFVQASLYDFDNKQLTLPNATFTWVGPSGYSDPVVQMNDNEELIGCTISKDSAKNCYNGILSCSLSDIDIAFGEITKKLNLQTNIAIPYGMNQNLYIEGASSIIYDSNGANPQYYKKPYVVYNKTDNSKKSNVTWSLKHYNQSGDEVTDANAIKYQPRLSETNILLPHSLFIESKSDAEKLYTVAIATEADGTVVWAQPIIISQNRYSSAMVNKWDGGLSIDEENGTILSTMVGAGRKDKDNKFEGVLMGDVGASGDDALNTVGLYGFNAGAQSFGFLVDGTAFIGKQGRGRIYLNGNNSIIQSAEFAKTDETATGMGLDLDDGFISIKNSGKEIIHLDSKAITSEPRTPGAYLQVNTINEKPILVLDNDEYYLKTENYVASTQWKNNDEYDPQGTSGSGMKIDLETGTIDAYNFTLRGEDPTSKSYIKLSNNTSEMIKVFYRDTSIPDDDGLITMEVGTNNYILRSFNWWNSIGNNTKPLTGMEIDLGNSVIQAYSNDTAASKYRFRIDASDSSGDSYGEHLNSPLTIGTYNNPAFKVNWDGSMYSTSGEIGGWKITQSTLESVDVAGTQKMTLNKDGSIKIGTYAVNAANQSNAFEVTNTGIMKAANFELASGIINSALMMKGKMRVGADGDTASVKTQSYQMRVDGTSLWNGNIYVTANVDFITVKSDGTALPEANRTVLSFPSLTDGSNGVHITGATTCLYTKSIWIGYVDGATTTYLNGNIYLNDTSADGKVHFPHPDNIMAGYYNGVEQTLAQYIARQLTGENAPVEFVANNAQLASEALTLSVSKGQKYSVGGSTKPVYFSNGIPVACDNYPSLSGYATQNWVNNQGYLKSSNLSGYATEEWVTGKGYATESWVENKNYLISIPSEYVTETELSNYNYLTAESNVITSLSNLITELQSEINELKEQLNNDGV